MSKNTNKKKYLKGREKEKIRKIIRTREREKGNMTKRKRKKG